MARETIWFAERYLDLSETKDESEYYHTSGPMAGIKNFNEIRRSFKRMGKFLNEIGKDYGWPAKSGD